MAGYKCSPGDILTYLRPYSIMSYESELSDTLWDSSLRWALPLPTGAEKNIVNFEKSNIESCMKDFYKKAFNKFQSFKVVTKILESENRRKIAASESVYLVLLDSLSCWFSLGWCCGGCYNWDASDHWLWAMMDNHSYTNRNVNIIITAPASSVKPQQFLLHYHWESLVFVIFRNGEEIILRVRVIAATTLKLQVTVSSNLHTLHSWSSPSHWSFKF